MPSKVRFGLAIGVSVLPLNALRVLGYRALGYDIRGSRIGPGTIIAVDSAVIRDSRIGPLNRFLGPISVEIGPGAVIGNRNEFSGGEWTTESQYEDAGYGRTLRIGAGATVTSRHFFDVAGRLTLGDRSWVAGIGSQFWTHGAGIRERDVSIGADCYIGSSVRFAPGSAVGNNVLVALGSVVSGRLQANDAVVGGVPAKVLRSGYDWRSQSIRGETAEDIEAPPV